MIIIHYRYYLRTVTHVGEGRVVRGQPGPNLRERALQRPPNFCHP